MSKQKTWLVEEPLSQYKEDVKALAKEHNLVVVNARFGDMVKQDNICENPPALTKKRGRKPGKAEENKPSSEAASESVETSE